MDINFSNSGVGDNQILLLADALTCKQGKLQVVNMGLSGNMLSDKIISDLFNRASVAFKFPAYLDLSYNKAGVENIKSITTAFEASPLVPLPPGSPPPPPLPPQPPQFAQKVNLDLSHSIENIKPIARPLVPMPPDPPPQLTQKDSGHDQLALERILRRNGFPLTLILSHNDLQLSGMQALQEGMCLVGSFGNLECLYLNGSLSDNADFNAAWLTVFLEACSRKLTILDISQNNLSVPGALVLGSVINSYP